VGLLSFEFEGDEEVMEVHLFKVDKYTGEPAETEEMRPKWYDAASPPVEEMWPDDKYWLPHVLAGKQIRGYFRFKGMETISGMNLEVLDVGTTEAGVIDGLTLHPFLKELASASGGDGRDSAVITGTGSAGGATKGKK